MEPASNSETPVKPVQNKKILIVAIVVAVVMIVFFVIAILSSNTKSQNNAAAGLTQPVSTNSTQVSEDPNPVQNEPSKNIIEYKNSLFSVNYPIDWKAEEIKLANGGFEVRIRPMKAHDQFAQNIIIIADSISSVPSIKQKQQAFIGIGFVNKTTLVDSLAANKITGIFPPVSKTGTQSAALSALQMTHIYLDKGNFSYLFDYSYADKGFNPQIENVFENIVSSFKFAK